ncbi:MAG: HD domain-containing phosphohydrolase [Eubacteriales bacterium]
MKLKDIKLSNQFTIALSSITVLVVTMGIVSYLLMDNLWKSAEALHDHPFATKSAIASILEDVFNIRQLMEVVAQETDKVTIQSKKVTMDSYEIDAFKQIDILNKSYLGPKSDIENVKNLLTAYHSIRYQTLDLLAAGNVAEVKQRVGNNGICGVQANAVVFSVKIMSAFANKKADELYSNAQRQSLLFVLLLGVSILIIIILSFIIGFILRRNILPPIMEIANTMDHFEQGKSEMRSSYKSANALGRLSDSFNKMADRIGTEMDGRIKIAAELLIAEKQIDLQSDLIKIQEVYYIEKQLLEATLVSIGDAVISCDNNSNIIFLNKVAELLTGWNQDDALGKPIDKVFDIANEVTKEKSENIIRKVILSGEISELANHTILISKDGIEIPIEDSAAPIFQENGVIVGAVLVFRDVSDKRERLKNIEYLSYHDGLTGLYNRRFYEEELKRIDTSRNLPLTIVMGDVNGLKLINDSFGHTIGDELLQKTAKAIKKGCRSDDIIARIGGDEFIAILPNTDEFEAEKLINRVKSIIFKEKVKDLEISISFGHCTKKTEDMNVQEIFKAAEDNMYKQKLYESSSMRSKTVDLIMNTLYEKNNREMLHSKRVSEISEEIAKEMNLDEDQVNQIKMAGLMHDIGKIGINEKVLNKIGKLNDNEFSEIKRHPETGYRILSSVSEFSEMSNFVLAHHERWDGKGYPRGLKGEEIPVPSRIIALADSYDAMISERTYKKVLTKDEAIEEIKRCSGTQFDPDIARAFIYQVLKSA